MIRFYIPFSRKFRHNLGAIKLIIQYSKPRKRTMLVTVGNLFEIEGNSKYDPFIHSSTPVPVSALLMFNSATIIRKAKQFSSTGNNATLNCWNQQS